MKTVYVIFQFDTEDFITPEADDVLLDLLRIVDEHHVKASFCIVAEKARVLERRGRRDIIKALRRHDIAYQSNFHSIHPVISEYLAEEDWDSGVEKVIEQEAPGLADLVRIFGVKPSAFIQPGGSWAPETPYAVKRLGIPVYADGIFESEPFWFCGNLCLKASMYFPERSTMDDLGSLKENFRELYAEKQVSDGLIVIFSHPCMFITETFWDSVNFHDGKNPIEGRYVSPPLRSKEAYNESLKAFEKFLEYILGFPNVKIVTFKEIPNVYHEPEERMLSLDKILSVAEEVTIRDNWQIVNGISVSPAEVLRLLTELILNYLSRGDEPESIPIRFTLGPTSKPSELGVRRTVRLRSFLSLCYRTKEFMEEHDKIPSTLSEGNFAYGPGDLLAAAAMAVTFYSEFRRLPSEIKIGKASNLPDVVERWNLASRVKSQWKWIIFSRDFNSHKIEDLTIGQSWTIRPAVLS